MTDTSAAQRVSVQLRPRLHTAQGQGHVLAHGRPLMASAWLLGRPAPRYKLQPLPLPPAPPQAPADPRAAEEEAQKYPQSVLGARIWMHGPPTTGHRAHWQHSATCLKSSSPCSSLKHCRQWGHCRSPWPLWVTPEHPPSAGRSSHWDPVPGLRPPAATGSEASVSKYLGDLLPV